MNLLKTTRIHYAVTLMLGLWLFPPLSLAAPNLWSNTFEQGWTFFNITNEQNNAVNILCNAGVGEDYDNSMTITLADGKEYTATNADIEFIIDDEVYGIPPETLSRINGGSWDLFITAIAKATAFDVYINNKKVATFKPRPKNVQKVLKDMGCDSLFARSLTGY